jgi:hypothetical protein
MALQSTTHYGIISYNNIVLSVAFLNGSFSWIGHLFMDKEESISCPYTML